MRRVFFVCIIVVFVALFGPVLAALAQANQPGSAPSGDAKPDMVLLKRTPSLDGTIEAGEWDPFCQVQTEGFSAAAYVDWDENNLYVAAQGDKPLDLTVTIDACNDGWFHGSDNYLLRVLAGSTAPVVVLERYNSQAMMNTPGATQAADASRIVCKSTVSLNAAALEIAIPASQIEGLKLAPSGTVGLKVALRQAAVGAQWQPMAALGAVEACSFQGKKVDTLKQLDISLVLQDQKVVAGQTLRSKLYIKNTSDRLMSLDSFVIGGDGRAAKYLHSERMPLEPLPPGKSIKHVFESKILAAMPLGVWALGAEVRSADPEGGRLAGVLTSFDVAKPFELDIDVGETLLSVTPNADRVVRVKITNHTPDGILGSVTMTLPEGWKLKPSPNVRRFQVRSEDKTESVRFHLRPPVDAAAGDVPIKVDIIVDGETFTLAKNITLVRPVGP